MSAEVANNIADRIIETAMHQGFQCAACRMNETAYLFTFFRGFDDGSWLEVRIPVYIGVRGGVGMYRKYYIRRMSIHSLRQRIANSLALSRAQHERRRNNEQK